MSFGYGFGVAFQIRNQPGFAINQRKMGKFEQNIATFFNESRIWD